MDSRPASGRRVNFHGQTNWVRETMSRDRRKNSDVATCLDHSREMSEVIGSHFFVDPGAVGFDGFGGDAELAADFEAGVAFNKKIVE